MNVNFIRTGVLISMNLDPEGVIAAAAGSAYDGVHTDTHTHTNTHRHTHINSKYIYIFIHYFFFLHPTRNGFRGSVRTSPALIVTADLTDTNTCTPSLARRTALGQSRPRVVLTL